MPEQPLEFSEEEEIEIDLRALLREFIRHIVPILLVAFLCAAIGFCFTRFVITPVYSSTSSMYVVSASANSMLDLSDLNFGTTLAKDYEQIVQSRTMLERIIAVTGEDLTVDGLRSMLTVTNVASTRILQFKITGPDPEQTQRLSNAFVEQAVLYLPEIMEMEDNKPHPIDSAKLPERPDNMNYVRNICIGFLAGGALMCAIYTLLFISNDTFDSSEDVEKYMGLAPIACIPENGQKHRGSRYGYYYSNSGSGSNGQHLQKKEDGETDGSRRKRRAAVEKTAGRKKVSERATYSASTVGAE